MRSAAPPKKKKIHLHTYPAGQKTGCCVASLSRHTQSTGSTCLVLTHRAVRLGALRSVKRGAAGLAQSDGGRSVAIHPVSVLPRPPPSQSVAIRGVLAGFCGDVATPSPAPSQTPSSTCVWLSPTLQTRSVHVVLPLTESFCTFPTESDTQNRYTTPLSGHFIATFCPRFGRSSQHTEPRRRGRAGGHLRCV